MVPKFNMEIIVFMNRETYTCIEIFLHLAHVTISSKLPVLPQVWQISPLQWCKIKVGIRIVTYAQ
jgi:hypothetical protein